MDSWWEKFFVKTFLLMALMLNRELSAIIQVNVKTLAGISTKCHLPPKSWNDKGGIRRSTTLAIDECTSYMYVRRIRIAVEDASSCFFFVTHVLVPVSSDWAAQLMRLSGEMAFLPISTDLFFLFYWAESKNFNVKCSVLYLFPLSKECKIA